MVALQLCLFLFCLGGSAEQLPRDGNLNNFPRRRQHTHRKRDGLATSLSFLHSAGEGGGEFQGSFLRVGRSGPWHRRRQEDYLPGSRSHSVSLAESDREGEGGGGSEGLQTKTTTPPSSSKTGDDQYRLPEDLIAYRKKKRITWPMAVPLGRSRRLQLLQKTGKEAEQLTADTGEYITLEGGEDDKWLTGAAYSMVQVPHPEWPDSHRGNPRIDRHTNTTGWQVAQALERAVLGALSGDSAPLFELLGSNLLPDSGSGGQQTGGGKGSRGRGTARWYQARPFQKAEPLFDVQTSVRRFVQQMASLSPQRDVEASAAFWKNEVEGKESNEYIDSLKEKWECLEGLEAIVSRVSQLGRTFGSPSLYVWEVRKETETEDGLIELRVTYKLHGRWPWPLFEDPRVTLPIDARIKCRRVPLSVSRCGFVIDEVMEYNCPYSLGRLYVDAVLPGYWDWWHPSWLGSGPRGERPTWRVLFRKFPWQVREYDTRMVAQMRFNDGAPPDSVQVHMSPPDHMYTAKLWEKSKATEPFVNVQPLEVALEPVDIPRNHRLLLSVPRVLQEKLKQRELNLVEDCDIVGNFSLPEGAEAIVQKGRTVTYQVPVPASLGADPEAFPPADGARDPVLNFLRGDSCRLSIQPRRLVALIDAWDCFDAGDPDLEPLKRDLYFGALAEGLKVKRNKDGLPIFWLHQYKCKTSWNMKGNLVQTLWQNDDPGNWNIFLDPKQQLWKFRRNQLAMELEPREEQNLFRTPSWMDSV